MDARKRPHPIRLQVVRRFPRRRQHRGFIETHNRDDPIIAWLFGKAPFLFMSLRPFNLLPPFDQAHPIDVPSSIGWTTMICQEFTTTAIVRSLPVLVLKGTACP